MLNLCCLSGLAVALVSEPAPLTPDAAWVVGDVREAWRRPVHVDAVEHMLVMEAGDIDWQPIEPNEHGHYEIPRDGWGRFIIESDDTTPALLSARAFGDLWINGMPRGGDVYGYGVEVPFMLEQGSNEILMRGGRGGAELSARTARQLLESASAPGAPSVALVSPKDRTVADAIRGEAIVGWAGLIVQNIDAAPLTDAHIEVEIDGTTTVSDVPHIPAVSFLKVPVRMRSDVIEGESPVEATVRLRDASGSLLHSTSFDLRTREADQWHTRTFRSDIDGSVQYYAVRPAIGDAEDPPGIALSLHGASVEATGQARCFRGRDWCHVVAPTNRRPFGFDWEDWGRLDALEALADARTRYPNSADRTWLTGHSMGGHGTWNVGLTVPDRWAAIAPSAGWATFWSYGGPDRYPDAGVHGILRRAANPSDTMLVLPNAERFGVYILHGDADKVVPVSEARTMRAALAEFHPNWAYYEKPGAGHWWGDQCMDWPPLFEYLKRHTLGSGGHRDALTFVTVDPASSARCDWVVIEQQQQSLEPSRVDVMVTRADEGVAVTGTTRNVARLAIDPAHADVDAGGAVSISLDDHDLGMLEPTVDGLIHVRRDATGRWHPATPAPPHEKNTVRAGRLRSAWNNNVLLVVGTAGTDAETAWNRARARHDAERWWYRGNGLVEIIDDTALDPSAEPDRGVMLYGHAGSNAAWPALLGDSPVQVHEEAVVVGDRTINAPAAVAFVRPRPGSDRASVGVVTGTTGAGARLAATMPLFYAGVGWPDWIVIEPSSLETAEGGVVGAGFFDNAWRITDGDSAWRAPAESAANSP